MPLFMYDKEYARCSHDVSLITQKADAYITQLYFQLHTQSIEKDEKIERLSLEVSDLQKSNTQLLQLIEHKDLEINEKNLSIKGYLDKIIALIDTPKEHITLDKLREDIYSFLQDDEETLYETWERFKDLLRRCPDHKIPLWSQVDIFHKGLLFETRQELHVAAGGSLYDKTAEDSFDFIEKMAMNDKLLAQGVHEVDADTPFTAKLKALDRLIEQMKVNDTYDNTYNSSWRNYSNTSSEGSSGSSSSSNSNSSGSSINQLPTGYQHSTSYQQEQHQYY